MVEEYVKQETGMKQIARQALLVRCFMLCCLYGLFFNPEDGGNILIQNFD
jgi:hypothetical protein